MERTRLPRPVAAHEGIPLAGLEAQLCARQDLDAVALDPGLALLVRGRVGRGDGDVEAFNVELVGRSARCGLDEEEGGVGTVPRGSWGSRCGNGSACMSTRMLAMRTRRKPWMPSWADVGWIAVGSRTGRGRAHKNVQPRETLNVACIQHPRRAVCAAAIGTASQCCYYPDRCPTYNPERQPNPGDEHPPAAAKRAWSFSGYMSSTRVFLGKVRRPP